MPKLLVKIAILICITILPLALINFIIDPLQCFRVAHWYKPLYDPNERVQSACLARSHPYNSIILGASHVQNFDPEFINQSFNFSTLKLTLAGSTLYEQNKLLALAIKTGKVRNVIWGLDTNLLFDNPRRTRDDVSPLPEYIYKPSFFNDIIFLLDPYIIKHYVKMAAHTLIGVYDEYTSLRDLNNWGKKFTFSRARVLKYYAAVKTGRLKAMENSNLSLRPNSPDNVLRENIDENLLKVVRENPQVHFYIFFPPYTILRFADLYQSDRQMFAAERSLKSYLIHSLSGLKNVEIFDFQDVKEITHNFDNYKDFSHFSSSVDRYIIESLKSGRHRIKPGEEDKSLDRLRGQIESFDLDQLGRSQEL